MATLTTHVLDTALGRPARGVLVTLERMSAHAPVFIARDSTDADGRLKTLTPHDGLPVGTYRLTFALGPYFALGGTHCFYPEATVSFFVEEDGAHYHVPLLVAPYGYSTYRGS